MRKVVRGVRIGDAGEFRLQRIGGRCKKEYKESVLDSLKQEKEEKVNHTAS